MKIYIPLKIVGTFAPFNVHLIRALRGVFYVSTGSVRYFIGTMPTLSIATDHQLKTIKMHVDTGFLGIFNSFGLKKQNALHLLQE
ncbi:hypothetical protein HanPSC8_Chr09g0354711 [Helianthus annuus]|nr:hypothetical protein HanPSC8_Chr09g0354711 [Helianthus annuus]